MADSESVKNHMLLAVLTIKAQITACYLGIQLVPAHITDCSKRSIDTHLHSSLTVVVAANWHEAIGSTT